MIQKRELLHIWKELDINQNKYTMDKEDYVSLKVAKLLKEGTRPLGRWLCDRDYDIELTGNIYDNK